VPLGAKFTSSGGFIIAETILVYEIVMIYILVLIWKLPNFLTGTGFSLARWAGWPPPGNAGHVGSLGVLGMLTAVCSRFHGRTIAGEGTSWKHVYTHCHQGCTTPNGPCHELKVNAQLLSFGEDLIFVDVKFGSLRQGTHNRSRRSA
jgi:hypothetical protein